MAPVGVCDQGPTQILILILIFFTDNLNNCPLLVAAYGGPWIILFCEKWHEDVTCADTGEGEGRGTEGGGGKTMNVMLVPPQENPSPSSN